MKALRLILAAAFFLAALVSCQDPAGSIEPVIVDDNCPSGSFCIEPDRR